jgi:hypothetical protein
VNKKSPEVIVSLKNSEKKILPVSKNLGITEKLTH